MGVLHHVHHINQQNKLLLVKSTMPRTSPSRRPHHHLISIIAILLGSTIVIRARTHHCYPTKGESERFGAARSGRIRTNLR
jgi:hypothetical protein